MKTGIKAFDERPPRIPLRSHLKVGDRIGYAKLFLRTIGTHPCDDAWRRLGRITNVEDEWVFVRWDDEPDREVRALNSSIARVGSLKWAEDV